MLGMAAALVLGPWVTSAGAQSTLLKYWDYRQQVGQHNLLDEPTDMTAFSYTDAMGGDHTFVFVCGYFTHPNGATQIAVVRYDASDPNSAPKWKRYPENPVPGAIHKAAAMAIAYDNVDLSKSRVYVVGESASSTGADYVTLKFALDLEAVALSEPDHWGELQTAPNPRIQGVVYNGPAEGHDRAVDVVTGGRPDGGHRVVVTGTSWRGEPDKEDIFTIAYDGLDGSEDWSYSYDYCDGQDIAVEMGGIEIAEPGAIGISVVVAGTSWGGNIGLPNACSLNQPGTGFDIVAIHHNATGNLAWTRRYNGGENERCTGLAVPSGTSLIPGVAVACGVQNVGAQDNNTEYVAVAWEISSGDPYWNGTPLSPGVATWNPTAGEDEPVDAVIGYDGSNGAIVWMTGNVGIGDAKDIGTVAVRLIGGTIYDSDVYGMPAPVDERAAQVSSVALSPNHVLAPAAFVTGSCYDPTQADLNVEYATLKYAPVLGVLQLQAVAYEIGEYLENRGRRVLWWVWNPPNQTAPFFNGVFVTGRSGHWVSDLDIFTVRYGP